MRFLRIWTQTLLPPAITVTLYFIIFGNLIGSHIGMVSHVDFMQFLAPGLIMMFIITNSYSNVVSSFYSIRFQKSVDELLVSPTPYTIMITGYMLGGILRGVMVGLLVALISFFFTHFQIHHFFITVFITLLTAATFSLMGFLNAIFARSFDDIAIIPSFVLTPLTYLGGVFYSINQLSPVWQHISKANPILYIVNAFRYGVLGVTDVSITLALILVTLLAISLFLINLILLNKGIGIKT